MEKVLRGIVPPLVTPVLNNETLDIADLERLVEHVIAGGVSGVFVLGTTGEAHSLSFELRAEMIRQTAAILRNRLPLLVGITDTSLSDSLRLATDPIVRDFKDSSAKYLTKTCMCVNNFATISQQS